MRSIRICIGALLSLALFLAAPSALALPTLLNPKLSGSAVVAYSPAFQLSPDGSRVVYAGGLGVEPRRLFSAPTDGSAAPVAFIPPGVNNRVEKFAISPDGSRVVYLFEDSPVSDQLDLYSAPIEGGAPVKLNGPLAAGASVEEFAISPDGSRVVYLADLLTDGSFELFSVPIAGGANLRLNAAPTDGGSVLPDFAFTPSGSHIVYRGGLDTSWQIELYASRVDASGSTQLNGELPPGGDVRSFAITPNGAYAVYLADQDEDNTVELYRSSLPSGPPQAASADEIAQPAATTTKLNGPLVDGGSVKAFKIGPSGQLVVYLADAEQVDRDELYRVGITGGAPVKLNDLLPFGGAVSDDFALTPDGDWVIYRADQVTLNVSELFASSLYSDDRMKLNGDLVAGGNVVEFAVSSDSRRVVYRADQQTNGMVEVYSARLDPLSDEAPAEEGAVVPVGIPWAKLNGALVANGDVLDFAVSPAGDRVVYRANQETFAAFELYSVAIGGGNATKLNAPLVANGDALGFAFSADGSRVVYRADQEVDEAFSLYAAYEPAPSATIAGPGEPLVAGEYALTVSLSEPLALSGVEVRVEATGGDAVLGEDYRLESVAPHTPGPVEETQGLVRFAPGESEQTITLVVLGNPERTAPRTLTLALAESTLVSAGSPSSLELTLTPYESLVYVPLTVR
jgi:Tol biopolymer transport system component